MNLKTDLFRELFFLLNRLPTKPVRFLRAIEFLRDDGV